MFDEWKTQCLSAVRNGSCRPLALIVELSNDHCPSDFSIAFRYDCPNAKAWRHLLDALGRFCPASSSSSSHSPSLRSLKVTFPDITSYNAENYWVKCLTSPTMNDRPLANQISDLTLLVVKGKSEVILKFVPSAVLPYFPVSERDGTISQNLISNYAYMSDALIILFHHCILTFS